MTQEEINAMAKEAGLMYMPQPNSPLVRIVKKAVQLEREACAQLAMEFRRGAGDPVCGEVAAAIRARGQKGGV